MKQICSVEGCKNVVCRRGFCYKHYYGGLKNGTVEKIVHKVKEEEVCKANGCGKKPKSKGYCRNHYSLYLKYGVPEKVGEERKKNSSLKGQPCKHCGQKPITKRDFCDTCYRKYMKQTSPTYYAMHKRNRMRRKNYKDSVISEPYSKQQVWDKSSGVCGICGLNIPENAESKSPLFFTVDHIVPLSKGGNDVLDNLQAAHFLCNCTKQDLVLAEDKMLNLRDKISKLLGE